MAVTHQDIVDILWEIHRTINASAGLTQQFVEHLHDWTDTLINEIPGKVKNALHTEFQNISDYLSNHILKVDRNVLENNRILTDISSRLYYNVEKVVSDIHTDTQTILSILTQSIGDISIEFDNLQDELKRYIKDENEVIRSQIYTNYLSIFENISDMNRIIKQSYEGIKIYIDKNTMYIIDENQKSLNSQTTILKTDIRKTGQSVINRIDSIQLDISKDIQGISDQIDSEFTALRQDALWLWEQVRGWIESSFSMDSEGMKATFNTMIKAQQEVMKDMLEPKEVV